MKRLFIDLHAIQSVPPSNINRDDTGSPKTAMYGGVTRARVSSQSWKKAIRDYFNDFGLKGNVGIRSLNVIRYVAEEIIKLDSNIEFDEAMKMAEKIFNDANVKTKDNKVKALFFISQYQVTALAEAALNKNTNKRELQNLLRKDPSIDIALFGRMVADDPSLNEDASAQVAHSISTHAVQTEFDFFTATDDLSAENTGAGMLGTIEYNSSTLYRYANVNVHEFLKQSNNNSEILINSLKLFIEAFANSMPTGKVNTFANQTLPQALVIVGRTDRPVNLVSAFEIPIKSDEGYVDKSIINLQEEFNKTQQFVENPKFVLTIGVNNFGSCQNSLNELLSKFEEEMNNILLID